MNVELSNEQTRAWKELEDDEPKRVVFGGSAGGGKTFFGCVWQWHRRTNYPNSRGYIARTARESIKLIKKSVLVTWYDVSDMLGYRQYEDYIFKEKDSTIIFPKHGSEIQLLDLFQYPSDPDFVRLGSTEYTDGFIEEGTDVVREAADLILSRTRYKLDQFDLHPKQLITGNPTAGYIRDKIALPYFEGNPLPKETVFIPASLQSNPNKGFVKKYKALLEKMDQYHRARLLHGDWFAERKTGGEFYRSDIAPCVVDNIGPVEKIPLHITFDFNVNPYVTLNVWQVLKAEEPFKWVVRQIDEICLTSPRNKTKHAVEEFVRKYPPASVNGLFVYGDVSGYSEDTRSDDDDFAIIFDHLQKYYPQPRIPTVNPPIKTRGDFFDQIVTDNLGGIRLQICRGCTNTISDYNQLKVAPDGTKAKSTVRDAMTGVSYQRYGHTSDANDYFITECFYEEFSNFKNYTLSTPIVPHRSQKHGY